jgi:hypothetical protein
MRQIGAPPQIVAYGRASRTPLKTSAARFARRRT